MQPHELTLEGLTSYRRRQVVDFRDAPLFALVGATGAGKSSVIDGLCLALYGRVPRLGKSEIAPVIATSSTECTVGLEFTVRGRAYRAVRAVRRTKTGASTPEAVLEELPPDGAPVALAGNADEVTEAVEALLGLDFDQFTRAVVLPQGEFARVLHATRADRQRLLAQLLGTGAYERVKVAAGVHARAAADLADQIARQVVELGDLTAATVRDAGRRVARLDALVDAVAADQEAVLALREEFSEHRRAEDEASARARKLRAVGPPPASLRDLADAVAHADDEVAKRLAAWEVLQQQADAAVDRLANLGEPEELAEVLSRHAVAVQRSREADTAAARAEDLAAAAAALREASVRHEAEAVAAGTRATVLRRSSAAAQAAAGLHVGDACPVCDRALEADPVLVRPPDLDEAERELERLVRAAAAARQRQERAEVDLAEARERVDDARDAAAEARAALDGLPTAREAGERLERIRAQRAEAERLRGEARHARRDVEDARRARAALDADEAQAREQLEGLRRALAELQPPPSDGPVVVVWDALHAWAQEALPAHERAARDAAARQAAVRDRGTALRDRMADSCRAADVDPGDDPLQTAVEARARSRAAAEQLARDVERVARLREEEGAARQQAALGADLARLLRADQFQQWLLDEATRRLVVGATDHLLALSSGRYELDVDDRGSQIAVVDLASAGQRRSVKTLSGGETFLASLALALSLADEIAASAAGPVALESLFVDEGFGALDPEALDVAAEAIEQLGSGDRVVGVITHVAELADRIPVRFEVTKDPAGSVVTRVER